MGLGKCISGFKHGVTLDVYVWLQGGKLHNEQCGIEKQNAGKSLALGHILLQVG